jgi:hypothetical protein
VVTSPAAGELLEYAYRLTDRAVSGDWMLRTSGDGPERVDAYSARLAAFDDVKLDSPNGSRHARTDCLGTGIVDLTCVAASLFGLSPRANIWAVRDDH